MSRFPGTGQTAGLLTINLRTISHIIIRLLLMERRPFRTRRKEKEPPFRSGFGIRHTNFAYFACFFFAGTPSAFGELYWNEVA